MEREKIDSRGGNYYYKSSDEKPSRDGMALMHKCSAPLCSLVWWGPIKPERRLGQDLLGTYVTNKIVISVQKNMYVWMYVRLYIFIYLPFTVAGCMAPW